MDEITPRHMKVKGVAENVLRQVFQQAHLVASKQPGRCKYLGDIAGVEMPHVLSCHFMEFLEKGIRRTTRQSFENSESGAEVTTRKEPTTVQSIERLCHVFPSLHESKDNGTGTDTPCAGWVPTLESRDACRQRGRPFRRRRTRYRCQDAFENSRRRFWLPQCGEKGPSVSPSAAPKHSAKCFVAERSCTTVATFDDFFRWLRAIECPETTARSRRSHAGGSGAATSTTRRNGQETRRWRYGGDGDRRGSE